MHIIKYWNPPTFKQYEVNIAQKDREREKEKGGRYDNLLIENENLDE